MNRSSNTQLYTAAPEMDTHCAHRSNEPVETMYRVSGAGDALAALITNSSSDIAHRLHETHSSKSLNRETAGKHGINCDTLPVSGV